MIDLKSGSISRQLILFTLPMMAGNLLQQFYNIADTLIVGRFLGKNALAAVGSSYTIMTFLTSILIGLSMGAGALISIYEGKQDRNAEKTATTHAMTLILGITIVLNVAVYLWMNPILSFLQVPVSVWQGMKAYLYIIYAGMLATSIYNFFACLLRAVGNSVAPLWFLGVSSIVNILLDFLLVVVFSWGIQGAAWATVFSQYLCAVGILIYMITKGKEWMPSAKHWHFSRSILKEILNLSSLTCLQQSVMNFGILLVQGLVNSMGAVVMAAFAAAVKIDTFAYLPVQDFGNAFSTFVAQNYGAGKRDRICEGTRKAFWISGVFSLLISACVCVFARPLMQLFVNDSETGVIQSGIRYLRIEGACYIGIGFLFLLYGYYRGMKKAEMSLILTIISLGMRVVLAYMLAPVLGETGIWIAIPIGWGLADGTGIWYMKKNLKKSFYGIKDYQ